MALQSSGQISIGDIRGEFGGVNDHKLSEYYSTASGTPSSGEIKLSDFYGGSANQNSVASYLGRGTGTYSITGPSVVVIGGERVSSSNPTITSVTIDGVAASYTNNFKGGNDWRRGTRTVHKCGVYGYFSVPSGTHSVYIASNGTGEVINILNCGSMQASGSGIGSTTVVVGTAQTITAGCSSDKNSNAAYQGNMITAYHTVNYDVAYRSGNGSTYSTTVRANGSGRAGYYLWNGSSIQVTT